MDYADMADRQIEDYLAQAIAAARTIVNPRPPVYSSHSHCSECGDPIPEGRRIAIPGCTLCVLCTEAFECKRAIHRPHNESLLYNFSG